MRHFTFFLLLLGMARPPGAAKKTKKAAAAGAKVPEPDEAPVVDLYDYTSDENKEIIDASVQAVRDYPGMAMQQQAWEWLSTNVTGMMNQLRNGNIDSTKRGEFEKLQKILIANG
jgi:hypothetical protein